MADLFVPEIMTELRKGYRESPRGHYGSKWALKFLAS